MQEIERKYLLSNSIESLIDTCALKAHKITQYYTHIEPLKSVRYRKMDAQYYKTIKFGVGAVRDEAEIEISKHKYQKNFHARINKALRKNRYLLHLDGNEYAIDIFKGRLKGLLMMEIEFSTIEEFNSFKLPLELQIHTLVDVSLDENYKNKNLVLYGLPPVSYDINALFTTLEAINSDALKSYSVPSLTPIDTLRVVLYKYLLLILHYQKHILQDSDVEDLHQFRIAMRKSRAFLKAFELLLSAQQYENLSKHLNHIAKLTNHKRDLDVMQMYLQPLARKGFAGIYSDITLWQAKEQHTIHTLLNSEAVVQFLIHYQEILKSDTLLGLGNSSANIKPLLHTIIADLNRKIISKTEELGKKFEGKKLHQIRILLKQWRYLLEEFGHILNEEKINHLLKKTKVLQNILGEYNDTTNQDALFLRYFSSNKKKITKYAKLKHILLDKRAKKTEKLKKRALRKLQQLKKFL